MTGVDYMDPMGRMGMMNGYGMGFGTGMWGRGFGMYDYGMGMPGFGNLGDYGLGIGVGMGMGPVKRSLSSFNSNNQPATTAKPTTEGTPATIPSCPLLCYKHQECKRACEAPNGLCQCQFPQNCNCADYFRRR